MNKKMKYCGMIAMVSTALLTGGSSVIAAAQPAEVLGAAQPVQKRVVHSIESQATPLTTIDPAQPFYDLRPLKRMIGDARYVGLGEATHGTSEFFTMKFRLVKFLVTEMGFTNFGMEEDWGNGLKLNEYIQTGKGNPREFLKLLFPTDEIVAMVEWMKDYNADPKNKKKIQFIGLDLKALDKDVYLKVTDYVKRHHPELLSKVEGNYKELSATTGNLPAYMKLDAGTKKRFEANAQQVVELLENATAKDKPAANASELVWVKATAQTIKNFTSMMVPEDYPTLVTRHDQYMAEHAIWAQEALGGKTMVWAHNTHVAKGVIDQEWYPKVSGQFLKERVGADYVVIGSSTSEGRYTIYSEYDPDKGGKLSTNAIPQQENSTNDILGKVSYDKFLVDTRHLKGAAGRWMKAKQPFLGLGAQVIPNQPSYFQVPLRERFDILVHIRKTSPSRIS